MKFYTRTRLHVSLWVVSFLVAALPINISLAQEKADEETYSISLVQTAEVDKEIMTVEGKKVLTESYTVSKGDHIWQLFRERGLLEKRNLSELLVILKKLNKSLTNLDLIYPEQEIVIPLVISPVGATKVARKTPPIPISPEVLKDLEVENYTIRRGDSLIKVVKKRYDVPEKDLYGEYLQLLRGLNPSIQDLDTVHPGQVVRLPIYSPQVLRLPVPPATPLKPEQQAERSRLSALRSQLGQIFTHMGEEWIQTGDHYIPLKSGGQANLKAESFPVLNLYNGRKVIVDLYDGLPEKMKQLIESSWENYRIVHLKKEDDLRAAFSKMLAACNYAETYKLGEPLELVGDISIRITGDWIIKPTGGRAGEGGKVILITLVNDRIPRTPVAIKDFLRTLGIKAIDHPPGENPVHPSTDNMDVLRAGTDVKSLIETLLKLAGQTFSSQVDIPIYKSGKKDFNLVIKADFLLNKNGKDSIIDLTGLGADIIALLEEHQFSVLSLAGENDPSSVISKTLSLLDVPYDSKPHDFMAAKRDESKNIKLTIPGITFQDNNGQQIFATHLKMPDELTSFLSQRGFKLLSLS